MTLNSYASDYYEWQFILEGLMRMKRRIMLSKLSEETFVGQTFRHQAKISSILSNKFLSDKVNKYKVLRSELAK